MSSPEETVPEVDHDGERLMAYLDGELDAAARKDVQEQLSTNAELRQRMKTLQQTWDLLDELPREPLADDFTRITVEMVAVHAEGEAERRARSIARWRAAGICLSLGAAVIAAITGYTVVHRRLSQANQQLVEDLPILQQLDSYQSAGSVEFLRTLEQEGLFLSGREGDGREGNEGNSSPRDLNDEGRRHEK